MDNIHALFLQAVRAAITKEQVAWEQAVSPEDWNELFHLASTHHMLPMFFEAVYACPAIASADPRAVASARQNTRVCITSQAMKTMEFLQLQRRLLDAGVSALVVKGLICRELYPLPDHRSSGDEDVLIPPQQYSLCRQVFADFGMVPADEAAEESGAYEIPFGKPGSPIYIELHKSLFPPDSDAYGEFNRFFEDVHQRAVTVQVMGVPIQTLSPTDHLLYLILHAFKHFLHSGFGIRQVCDIVLFANRYGSQIQWTHIQRCCETIRADRFAAALFRIGESYLTFDPEKAHYPADWYQLDIDIEPLLVDLLCAGVYGQADMTRKHSSNITLDAVAAQKQGKKAKGSLRASLFPSAKSLAGRYPYLNDEPWLLPVAWASRMAQYVKRGQNDGNSAAGSLRVGSERVELMKQYGILE